MQLKTYLYTIEKGFDAELDKHLDSPSTVVFIFGSPEFKQNSDVFKKIKQQFPQSILTGCSSSGEIYGKHVYDHSLSIAVVKFKSCQIKIMDLPIQGMTQSFEIGKTLAKASAQKDLAGLFILSDGLKINGSELVKGLSNELPAHVTITGGLAGDGSRFQDTWILKDGLPTSGFISALGFYGNEVKLNHGTQGGWDIFGPERLVTKAVDNVLYELDGKPALALYKQYLGDKAAGLPATALLFPLQIRLNDNDEKRIVRTILSVDEAKQTMTFAGNIPQGSLAQLMRANFERLIDGASIAANQITQNQTAKTTQLSIAISCVGRRLVLGERIDEEVEATLEKLPAGTKQIGFYSYGEISPLVKGQACELHNQTMTLTTISEDEAA